MSETSLGNDHGASGQVLFQGSFRGLVLQILSVLLPFEAVISFVLFGSIGWRLFLASLALLPLFLILALLVSRMDRLTLDDEARQLRIRFHSPLEYGQIESFRFVEWMGLAQVAVRTRSGKVQTLLNSLDGSEIGCLENALAERIPGLSVRRRRYAGWKMIAGLVGVVLVFYWVAGLLVHRRFPNASTGCLQIILADAGVSGEMVTHRDGKILVRWPVEIQRQRPNLMPRTKVSSLNLSGRLFLRSAGFEGEYDLFRYACCGKFGLVPAILKSVLVERWKSLSIYVFDRPPRHGLCFAGLREGEPAALIVLRDKAAAEVMILLRPGTPLSEEWFKRWCPAIDIEIGE